MMIILIIMDVFGNVDFCIYNLIIFEFMMVQELVCVGELNFLLGGSCEVMIIVDMVFLGNLYCCYDNYIVLVYEELLGFDVVFILSLLMVMEEYVGQMLVVEVCDLDMGECCWGYVNVEYKLILEFICLLDMMV